MYKYNLLSYIAYFDTLLLEIWIRNRVFVPSMLALLSDSGNLKINARGYRKFIGKLWMNGCVCVCKKKKK